MNESTEDRLICEVLGRLGPNRTRELVEQQINKARKGWDDETMKDRARDETETPFTQAERMAERIKPNVPLNFNGQPFTADFRPTGNQLFARAQSAAQGIDAAVTGLDEAEKLEVLGYVHHYLDNQIGKATASQIKNENRKMVEDLKTVVNTLLPPKPQDVA